MRLNQNQKAKLLEWVAAGYQSDEINRLAAVFDEPFSVRRSQVQFYRNHYRHDFQPKADAKKASAIATGLALKEVRVEKLQRLAMLLEQDLLENEKLWVVSDIRIVGKDADARIVEREEFNAGEVIQYRGLLDDIAKEVGGRKQTVEQSGEVKIVWDYPLPPPKSA